MPEGAPRGPVDKRRHYRFAARVLGMVGALYGAFLVVIATALKSLDSGPSPGALSSVAIPAIIVLAALAGVIVLGHNRLLGVALFILSGLVLLAALISLSLTPWAYLPPAAIVVAAVFAFLGG